MTLSTGSNPENDENKGTEGGADKADGTGRALEPSHGSEAESGLAPYPARPNA